MLGLTGRYSFFKRGVLQEDLHSFILKSAFSPWRIVEQQPYVVSKYLVVFSHLCL